MGFSFYVYVQVYVRCNVHFLCMLLPCWRNKLIIIIIIISIECGKKVSPKLFSSFLSIRLEFQSEILPKYSVILCAQRYDHHSVSLLYFNVISIIVMPPSDFSVLKKFRTKNPFLKIAYRSVCATAVWIYYQRNLAFKFIRIEPSGSLRQVNC